jgi:hypothetical protein
MPLDGRFDDAREWLREKKALAAARITDASHRASAGIHGTLTHVKEAAGHGLEKARSAMYPRKTRTSKEAMTSNIDLCECSRRVQGHLAILYPELH